MFQKSNLLFNKSNNMNLTIRPLEHKDIPLISNYWLHSSDQHLIGMGVDLDKLPTKEEFQSMLTHQLTLPDYEKQSYALIWEIDGKPIGHCNVNKIDFGVEAYIHLHIWNTKERTLGYGKELVKQSLIQFFKVLDLKQIISEPYRLNLAPNKTLNRLGFVFEKTYKTIPGSINFEQEVNRWVLTKDRFTEL